MAPKKSPSQLDREIAEALSRSTPTTSAAILPKAGKRISKTQIVHIVQGNYGQGWEDVTAEETRKEALARLREYRENEAAPFRLIQRREKRPEATGTAHARKKIAGPLPAGLHAAYDWTSAAGELEQLATLTGRALDAYARASERNFRKDPSGETVTASDIRELAEWLRSRKRAEHQVDYDDALDALERARQRHPATFGIGAKAKQGHARKKIAGRAAPGTAAQAVSRDITASQIRAARESAVDAGDDYKVEWCDVALSPREDSDAAGAQLTNPYGVPTTRTAARRKVADWIVGAKAKQGHARKKKITHHEAKRQLEAAGIDFSRDYHEGVSMSAGNQIAEVAREAGYRKSKTAPGSTARMYFQYLRRLK